jgi:hypothetical protein
MAYFAPVVINISSASTTISVSNVVFDFDGYINGLFAPNDVSSLSLTAQAFLQHNIKY